MVTAELVSQPCAEVVWNQYHSIPLTAPAVTRFFFRLLSYKRTQPHIQNWRRHWAANGKQNKKKKLSANSWFAFAEYECNWSLLTISDKLLWLLFFIVLFIQAAYFIENISVVSYPHTCTCRLWCARRIVHILSLYGMCEEEHSVLHINQYTHILVQNIGWEVSATETEITESCQCVRAYLSVSEPHTI